MLGERDGLDERREECEWERNAEDGGFRSRKRGAQDRRGFAAGFDGEGDFEIEVCVFLRSDIRGCSTFCLLILVLFARQHLKSCLDLSSASSDNTARPIILSLTAALFLVGPIVLVRSSFETIHIHYLFIVLTARTLERNNLWSCFKPPSIFHGFSEKKDPTDMPLWGYG